MNVHLETKPFGIDVIIIEPGAITTELGDVSVGPLLERSGQGPYRAMAQAMADTSRRFQNDPNGSSPPSVIAETIAKALKARRPKTRYAAGKMAKQLLFMRKWGSDLLFDWVVGRLVS